MSLKGFLLEAARIFGSNWLQLSEYKLVCRSNMAQTPATFGAFIAASKSPQ